MVISDNPKYKEIIFTIAKTINNEKLETLLKGRIVVIKEWIEVIRSGCRTLGDKSIVILTNDINNVIDKIMGVDFE
tara:strand:- start:139 stop:366 length:228 start_codon:yes stop_codon:yes gene_type:complete